MDTGLESTIPIIVEYNSSLNSLLDKTQAIEHRLAPKLAALLQRLGLAGEPAIGFQSSPSSRAVRVRVHGELQPYPPDLMKRVWKALAPPSLRDLPETMGEATQSGFPDGWFKGYLTSSDLSGHEPSRELVSEYLVQLVYEIVQERPACLAGPAQISAYLEDESAHPSYRISPDSGGDLSRILSSLLDLGVSVGDKALVLQVSGVGQEHGRSAEDTVEGLFAQLRSERIEIHIHPQYLQSVAPGSVIHAPLSVYAEQFDAGLHDLFRSVEQNLFDELGIRLPDMVWVPSPGLGEAMIAVKINERLGPPVMGLDPGELLVDAPVELLAEVEIPGRPATNPANLNAHSTIVSELHAERVQQASYTAWTPLLLVALIVSNEIRRLAYRLLDIEYVEYQLAQLQDVYPELVRAATESYSIEDITRVLRGLVREGLSVRDMRAILERLLQYDTISIDPHRYVILDDRLPLEEGTPPELAHSWRNHREFVRRGLKYYIGARYAQRHKSLYAYLLDQELAAVLVGVATDGQPAETGAGLTEAEQEALRDAVWSKVGDTVATTARPVILTANSIRVALRELIALELPDLPVIARSEIPLDMGVEAIDSIGMP